ncbi:MAG: hypothetical protein A4E62_00835 [Syntrophorhabdus sp. PtaU1.Bin002]|nr:MAG: hypothetical protein A4E62_00835 [Syntrophorhabdus sp. PtaU1.Bin002]
MNLDLECAVRSESLRDLIDKKDKKEKKDAANLITKVLGVLQEDGIYAFYLYLRAEGKQIHDNIEVESKRLLNTVFPDIAVNSDGCTVAKQIVSDANRTLLAKELLERMLVYARYHAKGLGDKP